jgi:hypothetical protein
MRSFITLGVLSLVGASALMACGDDDSTPSTGQGGTAGTAGTAGAAGAAGAAGSGGAGGAGQGGTAGAAGAGGNGPVAACTGCVEIDIPFSAAAQNALYQINYPAPGLDFSNAVITWSIQVLTPSATFSVHPQVQNGAFNNYQGYFAGPTTPLTAANFPPGVWTNVVLDLSTVPGVGEGGADAGADAGDAGIVVVDVDAGDAAPPAEFDKTRVEALQLQILGSAAGDATVLIDSVTITGVTGTTGATFTAGLEGLTLNNYAGSPTPPGTPAPVPH